MTPQTLPDVVPDGATVAITANTNLIGIWVTISAPHANGADLRVGDSHVAAGRGAAVPPGTSFTFPRGAFDQQGYSLSTIYAYGASTDIASITYGA